jgi:hypothetical protein
MAESSIRLLVISAHYTDRLSYYDDWLDAFRAHASFDVIEFNIAVRNQQRALREKVSNCDAIVLLHSTNGDTIVYLEPYASVLADRKVPLLSFVGNEVNLPGSPMAEKRRVLSIIRPDWIATQLLQEAGDYLFGDIAGRAVVSIPHALNHRVFCVTRPAEERPIDIGARLARYLPQIGDDDRNRIVDAFHKLGSEGRLTVDISDRRYDREAWADFLNHCKATVSSEAGSWYLERDDAAVNAIRADVLGKTSGVVIANDSPLRALGHSLPWWARAALRRVLGAGLVQHEALINEKLSYEDIHARFYASRARPSFYGKCISSRHFDAIGTKTCQIMFPGRFNDILIADKHYLALASDFSNLQEVLTRFHDTAERHRIVEAAHAHIMEAHTYAHRMDDIEVILSGD